MLIIAPDEKTARELGGTDAEFHSDFLREETEFLIPAKRGLAAMLKGGEGSGEEVGHPFRGNQWTDREGAAAGEKPKRNVDRTLNERARRATDTHVPVSMRVRRGAISVQQQIADVIPGARNIPGNEPFDVHVGEGKNTKHLVEVKSIWKAKNDKVTVHPPALKKKQDMLAQYPKATPSMIIVDERVAPSKVYYHEGVGSFRFGTMTYLGKKHGDKMDTIVLKKLHDIYSGKGTKGGPGSGENVGHPFRGNQYTSGADSDAVPAVQQELFQQESAVSVTYDHLAGLPYESGEVRSNVDKDDMQMHDVMRKSVLQFAKEHGRDTLEMGLALVAGQLKEGASDDSAVHFDRSYTQQMDHSIHNHPSGTPFSSSDLSNMWIRANQKSSEVITPSGTIYRMEKLRNIGVKQEALALRIKDYWERKRNALKKEYEDNKEALVKKEGGAMRGTPFYIKELDTMMRKMAKHFKDDMRYTVTTIGGATAKSVSYIDDPESWDEQLVDYPFDETFDDDRMLDPWFEERQ